MTEIFDGRELASKMLADLKERVDVLKKKGITPNLVSILVGDDEGSKLYLSLKKKAAEKVGAKLEIKKFKTSVSVDQLVKQIKELNADKSIHGIMIQLPLPKNLKLKTKDIINAIEPLKDVDGMRDKSTFVAPVVMAVEVASSIGEEYIYHNNYPYRIAVVGGTGFVGRKIIERFQNLNPRIYRIISANSKTKGLGSITKEADVVISTTGVVGLIKADMVKSGAVLIDVGSPKGDIEKEAYKKASFVSPVPGGIGPLTIYYLLENLVEAVEFH